jgi:hypothetical protein
MLKRGRIVAAHDNTNNSYLADVVNNLDILI